VVWKENPQTNLFCKTSKARIKEILQNMRETGQKKLSANFPMFLWIKKESIFNNIPFIN